MRHTFTGTHTHAIELIGLALRPLHEFHGPNVAFSEWCGTSIEADILNLRKWIDGDQVSLRTFSSLLSLFLSISRTHAYA